MMTVFKKSQLLALMFLLPLYLAGCASSDDEASFDCVITLGLGSGCLTSGGPRDDGPGAGSQLSIFGLRGFVPDGQLKFNAHQSGFMRDQPYWDPTLPQTIETAGPVYAPSAVTIEAGRKYIPGGTAEEYIRIDPSTLYPGSPSETFYLNDELGGTFDNFWTGDPALPGVYRRYRESQENYRYYVRLTLLNTDFGGSGLNYVTYGIWETSYITGINFEDISFYQRAIAIAFGFETPNSAMPTTGMAIYTGRMDGRYSASVATNQTWNQELTGAFQLTADFATATMTGAFRTVTLDGSPFRDINASTSITNNTFAGTVATAPAAAGQTGPDMSGAIQGSFYGPSAEEVGGVLEMSGGGALMTAGFAGAK